MLEGVKSLALSWLMSMISSSLPHTVLEGIARPTIEAGKHLVILSEEWHTASTACNISDALHGAGMRNDALLLWNANNTMGFEQVDFARLRFTHPWTGEEVDVSSPLPDDLEAALARARVG